MFDLEKVRAEFPALGLKVGDHPAAFFDGPAGSQVPQRVIDAMSRYLVQCNANTGGAFVTSRDTDAMLAAARVSVAEFLGASDPDAVVFGPNMTTLTFALSRSLAKNWRSGDEVIVTRLDHDANVTPWILAARDAGAKVHKVGFDARDTTLDIAELRARLSPRTRLVAIGAASNATGTINPVAEIARLAHEVGADVFVDAVHYAPHAAVAVAEWNCDYVACSAYKFFGPHVGLLWGKRERMASLPVYQVRPAGDALPDRWSVGTQNHEAIAGTMAAIEYLADLAGPTGADRRGALVASYSAIAAYERVLLEHLLSGMAEIPAYRIRGITGRDRLHERVPTVSFTHPHLTPREIAGALAERGLFVWHGNYFALEVTEHLGLEPDGMVRVGILHYNTESEVHRLLSALADLDRGISK